MKRFLGILAMLLLGACLTGAFLAVTVLRPRSEVLPTRLVEEHFGDTPLHSRIQVTRYWELSPPWKWRFDTDSFARSGPYDQTVVESWQYGPFVFAEKYVRRSWPVAVEKAARATAVQKLGVKEPVLDIQDNDPGSIIGLSWHVVATAPDGKSLEMDFELSWDGNGEPRFLRRS